jgi:hypothetical protein
MKRIAIWIPVVLALNTISKDLKGISKKERNDLAALLDVVGNLLGEIADDFAANDYPYTKVATIETVGKNVAKHMTRFLRKKQRNDVNDLFKPFESLNDEWERRNEEDVINDMKYAAGEFKGHALLFKI